MSPAPGRTWTRPDAYVLALAQKRRFRRASAEPTRTQPEKPRLLLSTVPFLLVLGLLAILAIGIMIIAYPGNQPQPKLREIAAHERGVAERGWFQEAQREMDKH